MAVVRILVLFCSIIWNNADINCEANTGCTITSETHGDLSNQEIHCPTDHDCHIECNDEYIENGCQNITINAALSTSVKWNCLGDYVCKNSKIYFPDKGQYVSNANQATGIDHILDNTKTSMTTILIRGTSSCQDCQFIGKINKCLLNQEYPNIRHIKCDGMNACKDASYICGTWGYCELICDFEEIDCPEMIIDGRDGQELAIDVQNLTALNDFKNNGVLCPLNTPDCVIYYAYTHNPNNIGTTHTSTVGDCPVTDEVLSSNYYIDNYKHYWCRISWCIYNVTSAEFSIYYDDTNPCPFSNPVPMSGKKPLGIKRIENSDDTETVDVYMTKWVIIIISSLIVLGYIIVYYCAVKVCKHKDNIKYKPVAINPNEKRVFTAIINQTDLTDVL